VPFHINSPVNSDPPVVAGGDQVKVTLLLVTFVARTFKGHEGGAKEDSNYNIIHILPHRINCFTTIESASRATCKQ
jgi:hypothetical protein